MIAMLMGGKGTEVGYSQWVSVLWGYLIGSIPFGMILARVMNLGNLRDIGSGNIGATNVLRTGNKTAAALTLLLDGGKGSGRFVGPRNGRRGCRTDSCNCRDAGTLLTLLPTCSRSCQSRSRTWSGHRMCASSQERLRLGATQTYP